MRRVRHLRPSRRRGDHRARPARSAAPRPGGGRHRRLRRRALPLRAAPRPGRRPFLQRARRSSACPARRRSAMCAMRRPARRSCATCSRCSPNSHAGGLAVAHNGNLTNGLTLRRELIARRRDLPVDLRHRSRAAADGAVARGPASSTASSTRCSQIEGAYALVALTNKKLIGARDPLGIRPLVLGELDGCPILCSETCALDIIGAKFVRDIENGEVIVIDASGVRSLKPFPPQRDAALHLRIHLFRPARLGRPRPLGLRRAQGDGRANWRARRRPTPTSSCRCPIPACPRRSATPPAAACRSSSASSATITSAAPSSSRPRRSANSACAEAQRQPRGRRRQAHRADRRFDRARHHQREDRRR